MRFTLDEMSILSERLEKEEARLHQVYSGERADDAGNRLAMVSRLQRKLRDLEADLDSEERKWLAGLFEEERIHIHGHAPDVYERILQKLKH
jgi:hypothetical protein